ncbi:hypothetical protein LTS15_002455 [Exophiala xenobiotica]|nr:hypothetical protein LTS15_002455 [Exophiala xenobiotica]
MSSSTIQSSLTTQYHNLLDSIKARPANAALTSTAVFATLFTAWVVSDFWEWKSFGTGGTPPTWSGYWRMTKLRLNRLVAGAGDDLTDASGLSSSGPSYLDAAAIPAREGPRPQIVSRTMPQRQVPYKSGVAAPGVAERTANLAASFAARYPDILELRRSRSEGYSAEGIYAKESLSTINAECAQQKFIGTEVAHAHPAEGSLHVWLSEADAKVVVQSGWGQRFPLPGTPKGWIMVYAPRTMEEVDVVERIVKAGIAWVSGVTTMLV